MNRIIDFELLEQVIASERKVVESTILAFERLEKVVGADEINAATPEMVETYKQHAALLKLLQCQMYAPELAETVLN